MHLYNELRVQWPVSYAYGKLITFTAGDKMRLNLWEMFLKKLNQKKCTGHIASQYSFFGLLCSWCYIKTVTLSVHPPHVLAVRLSVRKRSSINIILITSIHQLSSLRKSRYTHSGPSIINSFIFSLCMIINTIYQHHSISSFPSYSEFFFLGRKHRNIGWCPFI